LGPEQGDLTDRQTSKDCGETGGGKDHSEKVIVQHVRCACANEGQ